MDIRFHSKTFAMIDPPPAFSEASLRHLEEQEARHGFQCPPALREWYAYRGCELLRRFSNNDEPVPFDRLGEPIADWYGCGPRDFVSLGLLWFMQENQGVCNWAVPLDGGDDPPVLVEVDSRPNEVWRPLATSFTEFAFCQVWDHLPSGASCAAQDTLSSADLVVLRSCFKPMPTTTVWPGSTNYRFAWPHGRILLWSTEQYGTDWFIHGNDAEGLRALLAMVWHCGSLKRSLYGLDETGLAVLSRMRRSAHT